jgi:hypothetical protein
VENKCEWHCRQIENEFHYITCEKNRKLKTTEENGKNFNEDCPEKCIYCGKPLKIIFEKEDLHRLSIEQIKQIMERGYTYVDINGKIIKATKEDLLFKADEIEKIERELSDHRK